MQATRMSRQRPLGRAEATAGQLKPAIVVSTACDYPQYAEAPLRLGAAGFVLKAAPLAELLDIPAVG